MAPVGEGVWTAENRWCDGGIFPIVSLITMESGFRTPDEHIDAKSIPAPGR
jgi:hypothetical protein